MSAYAESLQNGGMHQQIYSLVVFFFFGAV
jgi:hypothetical protein